MMKVKCIGIFLTEEQSSLRNVRRSTPIEYAITKDQEYVVLGITMMPLGSPNGNGAFYEIKNDWGQCRAIPSCLFEITNNRCSHYWKTKEFASGGFAIWPDEFFVDFFQDDLQEGEPHATEMFRRVVENLSVESDDG